MALPKDYADDRCSLARALEVVGERWTLLIVRDAFFGVRRFGDFAAHLEIPRAVLTSRLAALVAAGCGAVVGSADLVVAPGPGLAAAGPKQDPVSVALNAPHRLLEPLRGSA